MNKSKDKKIAKILNIIGVAMMVVVVLLMLPLTVPKLFGLKLYGVLSESMEPTLKRGAVVYVTPINASEVMEGDIISYVTSSGTNIVTTHRVVALNDDGSFITKGDNNNANDPYPVVGSRVIGRAVYTIPWFGALSSYIYTVPGACVTVLVFAFALALWIYAGIIDPDSVKADKKENKQSSGTGLYVTGIVLIILGLIGGGVYYYYNEMPERGYKDLREELVKQATPSKQEDVSVDFHGGNSSAGLFAGSDTSDIENSLSMLSDLYPNLVGWVLIPGTIIDYPIMHGTDDVYYLRHTYDGSYARPGSIFLSADNAGDFSDRYNVLYGHNQNNGNMFASLLEYDHDPSYIESHPTFYVATKDGVREYEIFSFFYVYPNDAMYTIQYYNKADYDILINSTKKAARVELPVSVSEDDELMVLSTCNDNAQLRFVVCGKRIDDAGRNDLEETDFELNR